MQALVAQLHSIWRHQLRPNQPGPSNQASACVCLCVWELGCVHDCSVGTVVVQECAMGECAMGDGRAGEGVGGGHLGSAG